MGLILLRHTTPDVAPGICYGQTDLDLAPSFPAEAAAVAAGLPAHDRIVTSPLSRCRRLAAFLAGGATERVRVDPRLAELDFGRWEMQPWAAIPRAELDAWAADLRHARPHGGETVAELAARVQEALDALPPRTLVVTHAGVIRVALDALDRDAGQSVCPYGAWRLLER